MTIEFSGTDLISSIEHLLEYLATRPVRVYPCDKKDNTGHKGGGH